LLNSWRYIKQSFLQISWAWGGLGAGDINGDGRLDIVLASGWWEQAPPGTSGLWKFQPVPFAPQQKIFLPLSAKVTSLGDG
jgi:hypothetical protein